MILIRKRIAWLCMLPLFLGACSTEEHSDLKAWMDTEAANMRGRVPPLPQLQTFPVVAYDVGGMADPFQASKLEPQGRGGANRPDTNRRKEPLEFYAIETMRMVGLLQMKGVPVALVQADKNIHQVRVGNYIGQNFGVITKITESEISIKELIEDANGDWVERVAAMQLQEQEVKK
ncbi:MAG: pilus assembly protein PilP [Moraxellaceae bacterium]|nr:pilus assembly protein PilP [Moraxellaceae bacterium]